MISIFFDRTPLLRFVIPFIIGIAIGGHIVIHFRSLSLAMLFFFLVFFVCIIWFRKQASYKWLFVPGIVFVLSVVAFGLFYIQMRKPIVLNSKAKSDIVVKIISGLGETPKSLKYDVELVGCHDSVINNFIGHTGRLYLNKARLDQHPLPGDIWFVSGQLIPFESPRIPFMFDYSDYLKKNRISFQFISFSGTCQNIGTFQSFDLFVFCAKVKRQLMQLFADCGMGLEESAVLNALFLGDKSELSYDQKEQFAVAGAMHLLAVSGLHVGIIYLLAGFLLNACGLKRKQFMRVTCIILILLGYAILTGLSPSVMRASIMFSMMEVGQCLKRRMNIFNVISASLLIILLLDPLAIYSIGFWLSHVAVVSIILFYPLINSWFTFEFIPFKWIWSLFSVSIAAQVGTFPLGIAIFHEFPVYFIISNLLLIPIVAPILILAILSVMFHFSSFLSNMLIGCLSDLLRFLNNSVEWIEGLPNSLWSHLYMDWYQVTLIYLGLIFVLMFRESLLLKYIRYLVLVVLFLGFSFQINHWSKPNQLLVVAPMRGKPVVNFIDQDRNEVYVNGDVSIRNIEYHLKGLWSFYNAPVNYEVISNDSVTDLPVIFDHWGACSVLFVRKDVEWPSNKLSQSINWIIFDHVPMQSVDELELIIDFDKIIVPGSWNKDEKSKWLQENSNHAEKIYLLEENEALIIKETTYWNKLNKILFGNMVGLSLNLR